MILAIPKQMPNLFVYYAPVNGIMEVLFSDTCKWGEKIEYIIYDIILQHTHIGIV